MKELRMYLQDIWQAIGGLGQIFHQKTLTDPEDPETRWAVERGIPIIGEAVFKADKLRAGLPITNLERVTATRHIIIHDYDAVDPEHLVAIRRRHLPILKEEVSALMDET